LRKAGLLEPELEIPGQRREEFAAI
jgi:hypothetical protein